MKKIQIMMISILAVVTMILSCSCEVTQSMYNYKAEKRNIINTYVNSKQSEEYSPSDWASLCEIAEKGKEDIENASSIQKIDYIVGKIKLEIDCVVPKEADDIKEGAFFIADDSWEFYIRDYADKFAKDENWIQKALKNGVETQPELSLITRNQFWVAVVGDQISISQEIMLTCQLLKSDNLFVGQTMNKNIVLWFLSDDLYVKQGDSVTHFIYNREYTLTEERNVKLEKPQNIQNQCGKDYVFFQWPYQRDFGILGCSVEIKKAGEENFELIKIEHVYMNQFMVQLGTDLFNIGENYVRITHLGGPIITNNKVIILNTSSDYITLIIDKSDFITIKESN